MFNLALLYEAQGRLAEALPLLEQSVDIAERVGSPRRGNVAASWRGCGRRWRARGAAAFPTRHSEPKRSREAKNLHWCAREMLRSPALAQNDGGAG